MPCRGKESFDVHIWMLKKFIAFNPGKVQLPLEYYVISASYEKMLFRMEHSISQHYLSCLKSLKNQTFQFNPDFPWPEKRGRNNNELIYTVIPTIAPYMVMPNLLKAVEVAKNAKAVKGVRAPGIYNESTCKEFHLLLCDSFDRFYTSLIAIRNFQDAVHTTGKTQPRVPQDLTDEQLTTLKSKLAIVQVLGNSLRAIVRSDAHYKHLATIEASLERYIGIILIDEGNSEEDSELQCLDPPASVTLLHQLYGDWANLMVGYIDASRLVRQYVGSLPGPPSDNVTITVLATPCPGQRMLSWKTLLRTKEYFPDESNGVKNQPTMDELIKFLTSDVLLDEQTAALTKSTSKGSNQVKRITIERLITLVNKFDDNITKDNMDGNLSGYLETVDSLILDVHHMKNCSSPGWLQFVEDIRTHLLELKNLSGRQARSHKIGQIVKMLKILREHSSLYQKLKPNAPLSIGLGFLGSRHCETSLACLTSTVTPLEQILDNNINAVVVSCIPIPCSFGCITSQYRQLDQ